MTNFAVTFPGQGSQAVGMLADLYEQYPSVKQTFEEASAALGYDLWALVAEGPKESLDQTDKTQPALLTASVALWRLWQEQGGATPNVLAGHSLGEYSALVCAGVMALTDAVKLVEKRGQYMQSAVPAGVGAMAAIIGLEEDKIQAACEAAAEGEVVSPVNFNSVGQVVIAGHAAAVERAGGACKEAGAMKVIPLAVSVPSHCALMIPAAEQLKADLDSISFNAPSIPVINNVDVEAYTDVAQIKDALVRQLSCPVQWTRTVQSMAASGVTRSLEMGPGKVLTGLNRRIDKSIKGSPVNTVDTLAAALEEFKQ